MTDLAIEKQMKIVILGGSGFIGTNALEYFKNNLFEVFNLDIVTPRNVDHINYWQQVDICDFFSLKKVIDEIQPDYLLHLAATTELNEKDGLDFYNANIEGVENVVRLCNKESSIKRVIFSSSMLVNIVGYNPKHTFDYNPSTLYGKSKVMGENIVFENYDTLTEFCIIRPTSIFGEWFGEPYKNFFDFVLNGSFYHPGGKACTKTYGYVGNTIYQIKKLFFAEKELIHGQVFYIGDNPPINISDWANEIAVVAGMKKPKEIPFFFFLLAALYGDFLSKFGIKFPMTSFRLGNMTTDHVVDLESTYAVCGDAPVSRLMAVKNTFEWIKEHQL